MMKTITTKLRQLIESPYFPFLLLFILMLVVHLFLPMNLMDDRYYTRMTEKSALIPYLVKTYGDWSARIFILTAVRGMLGFLPSFVWRILNPAVLALLGFILSRLVSTKPIRLLNWFITFLLLAYPFIDMRSAGWVTTSLNYLWVLTFGLYAILIAFKALIRQRVPMLEFIVAFPALLYGANQEQMVVILLVVFIVILIVMIREKRFHWFILAGSILSTASLVFLLTAPGNAIRRTVEINNFIDFGQLSLVDKLQIGVSSTLERFFFRPNLLMLLLCVLLVAVIFKRYTSLFHRVYALVPLVGILFFGSLNRLEGSFFPYLQNLQTQLTDHGFITLENFTKVSSYLPFLIPCLLLSMILILAYAAFADKRQGALASGILLLGFVSRVMMGFSPTVWTSSSRTFIFMYGAVILCGAMLFRELIQADGPKWTNLLLIVVGFAGGLSFLNLVAGIFQA